MPKKMRWGILGTGAIANSFAKAIKGLPDAEIAAVGSRAAETAEAFGHTYEIPRRHASYAALAEGKRRPSQRHGIPAIPAERAYAR